jgi:hypothetical protein
VITGGEMHRRTHNRHSPPNAMLNHFWQKIPSFQGETKPKPITPHDPHVFHPAAICRGPIVDSIDLGLVEESTRIDPLPSECSSSSLPCTVSNPSAVHPRSALLVHRLTPTVSAILAPRLPNGFSTPAVLSAAV